MLRRWCGIWLPLFFYPGWTLFIRRCLLLLGNLPFSFFHVLLSALSSFSLCFVREIQCECASFWHERGRWGKGKICCGHFEHSLVLPTQNYWNYWPTSNRAWYTRHSLSSEIQMHTQWFHFNSNGINRSTGADKEEDNEMFMVWGIRG